MSPLSLNINGGFNLPYKGNQNKIAPNVKNTIDSYTFTSDSNKENIDIVQVKTTNAQLESINNSDNVKKGTLNNKISTQPADADIEITKAVNTIRELNFQAVRSNPNRAVNFKTDLENSKFDVTGQKLHFNLAEKRPLGSGISKQMVAAPVLSHKNHEKVEWKERAIGIQKNETISLVGAQNFISEMRVQKVLSKIPNASNVTPKVYYAGMDDGKVVMVTKVISGGEAKHCLPHLSIKGRLSTLIGYGKGLEILHNNGILHNDTALRNMLIKLPTTKMNVDDALGSWLAKPIIDENGKRVIGSRVLITPEILEKLKSLNIQQVKVFTNEDPEGCLNDFGLCSFIGEPSDPWQLTNCAPDSVSSERHIAISAHDRALAQFTPEQLSKLSDPEKNARSQKVIEAAAEVDKVNTVKADVFAFGQLLCDAILRPGSNTDLTDSNPNYFKSVAARLQKRNLQYRQTMNSPSQNKMDLSGIDPKDYQALQAINPELAEIAFNLLKNSPSDRPELSEALTQLDAIISNNPQLAFIDEKGSPVNQSASNSHLDKILAPKISNQGQRAINFNFNPNTTVAEPNSYVSVAEHGGSPTVYQSKSFEPNDQFISEALAPTEYTFTSEFVPLPTEYTFYTESTPAEEKDELMSELASFPTEYESVLSEKAIN